MTEHVNIIVPINGKGQELFCLNLHVMNSLNIHKYDVMILPIVIQYWYFYKTSHPFNKYWWLASFLYVRDLLMNCCTYFFSKKKRSPLNQIEIITKSLNLFNDDDFQFQKSYHSGWPLGQQWWAEYFLEQPDETQPQVEDAGISPPELTWWWSQSLRGR